MGINVLNIAYTIAMILYSTKNVVVQCMVTAQLKCMLKSEDCQINIDSHSSNVPKYGFTTQHDLAHLLGVVCDSLVFTLHCMDSVVAIVGPRACPGGWLVMFASHLRGKCPYLVPSSTIE